MERICKYEIGIAYIIYKLQRTNICISYKSRSNINTKSRYRYNF